MLGKTYGELTDEPVTLYFSLQVQKELFKLSFVCP